MYRISVMSLQPTDIELIRRVLHEDDAKAFAVLMHRYEKEVYYASLRLMHNEDDAAEVTQLAFIQAYRQLSSWRGQSFGGWVVIIANHIGLRMLEKEKRRQIISLDGYRNTPNAPNTQGGSDPLSESYDYQRENQLQRLEQAVSELPEPDKTIVQEHYYRSTPLQTIARQLGMTENNVKVRLFRIREKLKKQLS